MKMVLTADVGRQTSVLPLALRHLKGEVPNASVQCVRRPQMWGVDHIVDALRMIHYPLALIGGVVEDQVRQRQDLPLILHELHQLFHVVHGVLALAVGGAKHRVQLQLVLDAVRGVRATKFLQRGEVDHIVARLLGHLQTAAPIGELSQGLGQVGLAADAVQGEPLIITAHPQDRIHHEETAAVGAVTSVTVNKTKLASLFLSQSYLVILKGRSDHHE